MAKDRKQQTLILFEEFIEFLRSNGFAVGVDTHLQVSRLLDELGDNYPSDQLKTLMAPIFVQSQYQQAEFYRLFDSYFDRYQLKESSPTLPPKPIRIEPPTSKANMGMLKILSQRRYYLAFQAIMIIGLGYLGVKGIDCYIQTRNIPQAYYCLFGINPPTALERSDPVTNTTRSIDTDDEVISPGPPFPRDSLLEKLTQQLQLPEGKPINEDISDLKADWFQRYGPLMKILIIFAIVSAFLFYESYKYNRKKFFLLKEREKQPPYFWTVNTHIPDFKLYTEQKFYEATRKLRERESSDSQELDMDKTISDTVESGGFPQLNYQSRTRPPEYLVLIEKQHGQDHQAMLFDQLILELAQQDIFVNRYFYEQDPRLCWKKRYEDEIFLDELYRKFPDDRLIIIGNVDVFFDPLTDELSEWIAILRKWKQTAIITPKTPLGWGHREVVISKRFTLLPSTTEALGTLVDIFKNGQIPSMRYWIEQNIYPIPPSYEDPDLIPALKKYFDTFYHLRQEVYEEGQGKDSFDWLCACTLYPELSWDLTLNLGIALANERRIPLTAPQSLFKLISLDGFQKGNIPEEIREILIKQLDEKTLKLARETIIKMLKENPPPSGSYAEAEHQLHLAIQEAQLNPTVTSNYKAIQEAQNFSLNHEIKDFAAIKYLQSIPRSILKFSLPETANKILFVQGLPALGIQTWVRAAVGSLLILFIIQGLDPSVLDRVRPFSGEHYVLKNDSSRMRFHTYAGNVYLIDSMDFISAEVNYKQSLKFKKESHSEAYLLPDYNLTYLQWKRGEDDEAREQFEEISDKADELMATARTADPVKQQLQKIKTESDYHQGIIHYRSQDLDKAEEKFRSSTATDSSFADAIYAEAVVFIQKGIRSRGLSQQMSFNLALNRMEDVRAVAPNFFDQNKTLIPVLDSLQSNLSDKKAKDRIGDLLAKIQSDKSVKPLPVPLISDSNAVETPPAFPPQLTYLTSFVEGWALVKDQGKYGFIDQAGNSSEIKYEEALPFEEGLAAVKLDTKWGYIDLDLKPVIPFMFEKAEPFYQGKASVKRGGKWGMIDRNGKRLINYNYDLAFEFEDTNKVASGHEPLAAVVQDGKYLYINQAGKSVFKNTKFQYAENFSFKQEARVKRWDKRYYINRRGECIPKSRTDGKCPTEKWYSELEQVLTGHKAEINSSEYSPNGRFLVTASADGTARIWTTADNRPIAELVHKGNVHAAAISPNSRWVATVSEDRSLKIWRLSGTGGFWEQAFSFDDARGGLWSVAFSPDSRWAATGASDQLIRIYDLQKGALAFTLKGHQSGTINSLAFSQNGELLASGSSDQTLRIWNWKESKELNQMTQVGEVLTLAFSPNGKEIAVGTKDNLVLVYGLQQNNLKFSYQLDGFADWVSHLVYSADSQYLLTTSYDNRAKVWNLNSKEAVLDILHEGTVRSASFSPDGTRILTASWGKGGNNKANIYKLDTY